MTHRDRDAFVRIRVVGIAVILSLIVFVTIVDVLDGLFFGDVYHVDITFYTLCTGLVVTFLTGAAIERVVARRTDGDSNGRS